MNETAKKHALITRKIKEHENEPKCLICYNENKYFDICCECGFIMCDSCNIRNFASNGFIKKCPTCRNVVNCGISDILQKGDKEAPERYNLNLSIILIAFKKNLAN